MIVFAGSTGVAGVGSSTPILRSFVAPMGEQRQRATQHGHHDHESGKRGGAADHLVKGLLSEIAGSMLSIFYEPVSYSSAGPFQTLPPKVLT